MKPNFPYRGVSSVPPNSKELKEKKTQKVPFLEIAAAREELLRIDRQLEELRGVHAYSDNGDATDAELEEEELRLKSMDPMLQAMINVELCSLASTGGTEEMRILLENGADPNTRDYDARSLLHIAAMNGNAGVIECLLAMGADPMSIDALGKTPAEYADMKGHAEITLMLSGYQSQMGSPVVDWESTPSSNTSQVAPDFSSIPQPMVGSLIVIMMGLPGRGKTFISRQICRYFQWNGLPSTIVSAKEIRNEWKNSPPPSEKSVVIEVIRRVMQLIASSGGVAIVDGSHETVTQRNVIVREILKTGRIKMNRIIFVEVIIDTPEVVHQNILQIRDYTAPEDGEAFVEQYYKSIEECQLRYKTLNPITDVDLSYIRMEDTSVYSLNQISGWMPSRLAFMLHNLNPSPKPVYLTRSGEYVDLTYGRIGGNSGLTPRGIAYGEALLEYFTTELSKDDLLKVFCSCATRATQTATLFSSIEKQEEDILTAMETTPASSMSSECPSEGSHKLPFHCRVGYFPSLEDINHGDCEGMLFSDVKQIMPYTIKEMKADPYHTPWPNGECLHQVFNSRLEPHIHDIKASAYPVLVISHLPLLQGLHCYFVSPDGSDVVNPQLAYKIKIPLESVVKIHVVKGERVAQVISLSNEVNNILARQSSSAPSPGEK